MNVLKVIEELKQKYPGKKIIKNDEENPTEIICEVDPVFEHSKYSLAIAVIDKSNSHHHKKITEKYKVIRGTLKLFKDGKKFVLNEGDKLVINPGETHWTEGNETWVECYSKPGWTLEDHIQTEKNDLHWK